MTCSFLTKRFLRFLIFCNRFFSPFSSLTMNTLLCYANISKLNAYVLVFHVSISCVMSYVYAIRNIPVNHSKCTDIIPWSILKFLRPAILHLKCNFIWILMIVIILFMLVTACNHNFNKIYCCQTQFTTIQINFDSWSKLEWSNSGNSRTICRQPANSGHQQEIQPIQWTFQHYHTININYINNKVFNKCQGEQQQRTHIPQ